MLLCKYQSNVAMLTQPVYCSQVLVVQSIVLFLLKIKFATSAVATSWFFSLNQIDIITFKHGCYQHYIRYKKNEK